MVFYKEDSPNFRWVPFLNGKDSRVVERGKAERIGEREKPEKVQSTNCALVFNESCCWISLYNKNESN